MLRARMASVGQAMRRSQLRRWLSEDRRTSQVVGFLAIALQQCPVHRVALLVGYLGMLDHPVESLALLQI